VHRVEPPPADIQDHLKKLSAGIFGGSAEAAAKFMRRETDRWGAVIKSAKIEPQ
jgi:hypothetical protein